MYVFLATLHQPWSLVFLKPEFVAPKGLLVDLHRKKNLATTQGCQLIY